MFAQHQHRCHWCVERTWSQLSPSRQKSIKPDPQAELRLNSNSAKNGWSHLPAKLSNQPAAAGSYHGDCFLLMVGQTERHLHCTEYVRTNSYPLPHFHLVKSQVLCLLKTFRQPIKSCLLFQYMESLACSVEPWMTSFRIPGHTRYWQQAIHYGDVCWILKHAKLWDPLSKEE